MADSPKKINIQTVFPDDDPDGKKTIAGLSLSPSFRAIPIIERLGTHIKPTPEVPDLMAALDKQIDRVHGGDLSDAESMLFAQANTMDALFHHLSLHAMHCMENGGTLKEIEMLYRLSFKAQSQSQMTIRSLGELKNPKSVAFVKQANIAENQQINNGQIKNAENSRARKKENTPSKLITETEHETLDFGRTTATVNADSAMATVEPVERPNQHPR